MAGGEKKRVSEIERERGMRETLRSLNKRKPQLVADISQLQVGQQIENMEYVGEMETSHFTTSDAVVPSETLESNQMVEKGVESFGKYGGSFITNQYLSGRKVIIGISTSDSFQGKIVGEHAFIMCINEDNPTRSVMLDASGHYGDGRTSDIIDGYHMKITIENYLKYWDTEEKLTTFELRLTEPEEYKIRNAILKMEGRSIMSCASKASEILNKNYSIEIEECNTPRGLLRSLNQFTEKYPDKVIVRHFDLKTDKEIFDAKQ
ncbi:MAG: hypothetical protein J6R96_06775 [Spirochaetaceae bacterium]|nr:hypothetical protein [Spirochaetaceae bacterium]